MRVPGRVRTGRHPMSAEAPDPGIEIRPVSGRRDFKARLNCKAPTYTTAKAFPREVSEFEQGFLALLRSEHKQLLDEISQKGELDDSIRESLRTAADGFAKVFG